MFPDKQDTLGWVAYISFCIAMLLFLSQIFLIIKMPTYFPPMWGILIFILFMLIGGFAQSFSISNNNEKPNQSLHKDGAKRRL